MVPHTQCDKICASEWIVDAHVQSEPSSTCSLWFPVGARLYAEMLFNRALISTITTQQWTNDCGCSQWFSYSLHGTCTHNVTNAATTRTLVCFRMNCGTEPSSRSNSWLPIGTRQKRNKAEKEQGQWRNMILLVHSLGISAISPHHIGHT